MGEHGCRVKIRREGGWSREDGAREVYGGMSKESTKVSSPLRNKKSFLVAKEAMIVSFEVREGGMTMDESMSKLAMESLAFFIILFIHGTRANLLGGGSKVGGVREGLEGCFLNNG